MDAKPSTYCYHSTSHSFHLYHFLKEARSDIIQMVKMAWFIPSSTSRTETGSLQESSLPLQDRSLMLYRIALTKNIPLKIPALAGKINTVQGLGGKVSACNVYPHFMAVMAVLSLEVGVYPLVHYFCMCHGFE